MALSNRQLSASEASWSPEPSASWGLPCMSLQTMLGFERERGKKKKSVGSYSNIASFLQCHFPAFEVHFNISCSKVSPSFHPSLLSDMNPSSSFSLQFSLCRNQHKLTCTYEEQQNNLPMCIDSASILKHLSGPRFPFLMYGLLFVLPLFPITPKSTLRHK